MFYKVLYKQYSKKVLKMFNALFKFYLYFISVYRANFRIEVIRRGLVGLLELP